jgi:hypothetical protein
VICVITQITRVLRSNGLWLKIVRTPLATRATDLGQTLARIQRKADYEPGLGGSPARLKALGLSRWGRRCESRSPDGGARERTP